MAQILTLGGEPINWAKPPLPTTRVQWSRKTSGGKRITGSLRTIAHLDRLNNIAKIRFKKEITVFQGPFNTTVRASAGTHDLDACLDVWIEGVDPWEQQRFFRANGFGGWMRRPPSFGWHYHGFTLPPREGKSISDDWAVAGFRVGKYVDGGHSTVGRLITSSQISDYYEHAFGLSGQHRAGSDRTWFPADIEATIFDLNAYIRNRQRQVAAARRKKEKR